MPNAKLTKIIRSNRRSLSMQILPDNTLIVKAPLFLPQKEIDKFINKSRDWIDRRLLDLPKKKVERKYQDGEEFLYLGIPRKLKIGDYKEIRVSDGFLLFPNFLVFRLQKELNDWFIKQAKETITNYVDYYSKKMNTSVKSLTFSDTKSKWGSCTHDNRLQFNWRLIMTPELVIRYVVIHELVHTIEHNHSRSFWSKVENINPSFKQQIKWLKKHGNGLVV